MLSRKNSFEQGNYLIKHSNLKPGHFGLIWLQNTLKHPLLFKMTEPALATLPKILIFNSNSWFIKLFLRDLDTFPCDQCIKSCAVLEILQQHIQTWIQSYQTTWASLQERVRISIYTKSVSNPLNRKMVMGPLEIWQNYRPCTICQQLDNFW